MAFTRNDTGGVGNLLGRVSRGAMWVTVMNVFTKVTAVIVTIIVLHKLSLYEYGFVELVLTVFSTWSIFSLSGFLNVVLADVSSEIGRGDMPKAKGIFLSFVRAQTLLCLVGFLLLFFGSSLIASWYNPFIASFIRIVSLIFLISPVRAFIYLMFSVSLSFRKLSLIGFFEELGKLGFVLFFFYSTTLLAEGLVYSIVLSQYVSALLLFPAAASEYGLFRKVSASKFNFLSLVFAHGKWSLFSDYLGKLSQNLRFWIIKFFLGTEAVAVVALAQGVIGNLASFAPIPTLIAPLVARYISDARRLTQLVVSSIKYQLITLFFISAAAVVALPYLFAWFFPHYLPALSLVFLMLPVFLPVAAASVLTSVFSAHKAQRSFFFSIVFKTVLIGIFLPLSIKIFGISGVALEYFMTSAVSALERFSTMSRKFLREFNLRSIFTFDEIDRQIFTAARMRVRRLNPVSSAQES